MYFHIIRPDSLPEPVFACSLTSENYRWQNQNAENCVEIAIIEGEELVRTVNGSEYALPTVSLNISVGGENVTMLERTGKSVCINTVAVSFRSLRCELLDKPVPDTQNGEALLLPCWFDICERKVEILRLIKTYIRHYVRDTASDRAMCVSVWFELAACIDRVFRETYAPRPFSASEYYIKKVDSLLARDYPKRFRVSSLAGELGVTPNYLSAIYRRGAGETITSALNRLRIQRARELALDGRLTTRDIAEQVGLHDEKYLRKLFKRGWGVSINECRLIDREITLYHKKPWIDD